MNVTHTSMLSTVVPGVMSMSNRPKNCQFSFRSILRLKINFWDDSKIDNNLLMIDDFVQIDESLPPCTRFQEFIHSQCIMKLMHCTVCCVSCLLSCDLEFVSGLISRDLFPFDPFVKFIERNLEKNEDYAALVAPFLSVFSSRLAVSNLALHSRLMDHYKSNGASSEDLVSRFPVDSENGNDDDRMILEPWRTDDVEAFQTLLSQTPKDYRTLRLFEKCIKFHATQCIKLLLMDSDYDFVFSREYYVVTLSKAAISAVL